MQLLQKMQYQQNKQANIFQNIIQGIQQQANLPIQLLDEAIQTVQDYMKLRNNYKKQQKISHFKDKLLQNIITIFQGSQEKMLKKLQALELINIQYIKKYQQAKKKTNKSKKSNINLSLNLESGILENKQQIHNQSHSNQQYQRTIKKTEDSFQNYEIHVSQSIFNSEIWKDLIKQSELKLNQIQMQSQNLQNSRIGQSQTIYKQHQQKQNQDLQEEFELNKQKPNNTQKTFYESFLKGIKHYYFQNQQNLSLQNFNYFNVINGLIKAKKTQIQNNQSLKGNIQLSSELQKLKILKQKIQRFYNCLICNLNSLNNKKQTVNFQSFQQIISQKISLDIDLEKVNSSVYDNQQFRKNKKSSFEYLSKLLFEQLTKEKYAHQPEKYKEMKNSKLLKKIKNIKDKASQSLNARINSLKKHISDLEIQSKHDKDLVLSLKSQNEQITKELLNLQNMKSKYQFYLQKQQSQKRQNISSQENRNKIGQKLDKLLQKSAVQQEKQLLLKCLEKKDELLQIQNQQLVVTKSSLAKVQQKISSYFKQQGIDLPSQNMSSNQSGMNFDQLFQNYSKSLTKQAYQKYPEQKQQLTKIIENKYKKVAQVQRQQFQQRIQTLKQELKLTQLQKDSYKSSLNSQQKQFTKLKSISEKLIAKRMDLQMQNSKTQQILKTVLDMMFAYLMSNISYENLLQQIQSTIDNIKSCLKYRQRQRQRENKQTPVIDYRFSGLSAVSNDFSFSKLNKQSYWDYFNQQSEVDQQSEVISKISSEDEVLPPSRPSYSTNNIQKRQMGVMDINQRATMAHEDQSLLGYLNPVQNRPQKAESDRNSCLLDGLHDQFIKALQYKFSYIKTRIPQQTIEVEKQVELDAKEMYIKYKQALVCLQQSQKINKQNQIQYQQFFQDLKEEGVLQNKQKLENKLFYLSKKLKQQEKLIQQQKIQFETTIAQQVIESQKTMGVFLKSLNKSIHNSR